METSQHAITDLLVGSTGFVGGNLLAAHNFAAACHSSDIAEHYGTAPDLCVYAGVPAAMFLANADPAADLAVMASARENLRRIAPKQVVLISTIAVYADSRGKTEAVLPETTATLSAYGKNRLQLEQWVREDFPTALIVRLPALYGLGLKKNFLYDLQTLAPAMLKEAKYQELSTQSPLVAASYAPAANGFYKQTPMADKAALRAFFEQNDFNALTFTDSRSRYQFYNLAHLWNDINTALAAGRTVQHLATPPLSAAAVYTAVTGKNDWHNELKTTPFDYDLRTETTATGYLCTAEAELAEIDAFLKNRKD